MRRIVRQGRTVPLRIGLVLAVAGIALLVVAGLLSIGQTFVEAAGGERAEVGNAVTFGAKAATYQVVLLNTPDSAKFGFAGGDPVVSVVCTVKLASGESITIDHTNQNGERSDTSAGEDVAHFEAIAGPTDVTCSWRDGQQTTGYFYAVGRHSSTTSVVRYAVFGAGGLALVSAVGLIIIGIRGHQVIIPAA